MKHFILNTYWVSCNCTCVPLGLAVRGLIYHGTEKGRRINYGYYKMLQFRALNSVSSNMAFNKAY
ncbi:hypothetical protein B7P43_G04454 [Cryptotermes secundus]|uniref:Uncharacterized protein n=1 Tax=Cryptotermes secundus TaxID=105785 RepID=A0A2J7QC35_9NEOP|nr:hypothetical protein B7P43_G04454 [Cryptotermes secundus]